MRPHLVATLVVLTAAPALGQTLGKASFVVYEKNQRIGTLDTTVTRSADGWQIKGSMRTTGTVPVTIVNLDLLYGPTWSGRFMTMEMKAPDDVIVHVAVVRATAQTDVVRATEARFQSHSVSPTPILLPERAYGAYEAVAARLAAGATDVPLFVPPIGETRAIVEAMTTEQVRTARGVISATHYVLTEIRERPTRVEIWVHRGRLLRLDMRGSGLSVVRADVRR